jgi:hypothetical protein
MKKMILLLILFSISLLSACHAWRGVRWYTADLEDVSRFDAVEIAKSTQVFEFKSGKRTDLNNAH